MRPLLLGTLTAVLSITPASAQDQRAEVLETVEVSFTSTRPYGDPHRQGALEVTFAGPDGQAVTVAGFWDGGDTFRARFAPPTPGTWTYYSSATDTANPGLHEVKGTIEVWPYTGTDPFRLRGRPRVSDDGRHLVYGDGEPLFLLADWAAEASWRSVREDIAAYLDDRAAKGFAAVQVVASAHNRHFPQGVTNQYGQPLHPPYEPALLNPRYFDHLDWIVSEANARGLAVMLYPIWAATVELHSENGWYGWYVPTDAALLRARYVAARYAGHNVIWVIGGDQYYDTPDVRDFWREVGRAVDEASGGNHLITAHSSGWSGTFQYFNAPQDDWLDFHAYTPTHWAGGDWSYNGPAVGARAAHPKPLLNIESNFEGLFHRFWDFMADTSGTFRLEAVHAREAAYWGVLSGALAGYSYGANGIWQWTTEATRMEPGDLWPRHTVTEALDYPGSTQVAALRRTMEALDWTELAPRRDLLLYSESEDHIALAASKDRIVAYLPTNTSTVLIRTSELAGEVRYQWVDVRTGEPHPPYPNEGPTLAVSTPDRQDWLLVVSGEANTDTASTPPTGIHASAAPNPFRGHTSLRLHLPSPSAVEIAVYDMLGRRVHHDAISGLVTSLAYPLELPTAGGYVCHVRTTAGSGARGLLTLKLLSLGR